MSEGNRKLRLGVAGLGRAFTVMLPTFAGRPARRTGCGRRSARGGAASASPRTLAAKLYATVEELCADPDVEVVYVATPHQHHAAHAIPRAAPASMCWSKSRWR